MAEHSETKQPSWLMPHLSVISVVVRGGGADSQCLTDLHHDTLAIHQLRV